MIVLSVATTDRIINSQVIENIVEHRRCGVVTLRRFFVSAVRPATTKGGFENGERYMWENNFPVRTVRSHARSFVGQ